MAQMNALGQAILNLGWPIMTWADYCVLIITPRCAFLMLLRSVGWRPEYGHSGRLFNATLVRWVKYLPLSLHG